jgi:hypothetical protein
MRPERVRWLIAGVVAVATAGICLGVWLNRAPGRASAPVVDRAQVRVMLPAITAYLQSAAYRDRNGEVLRAFGCQSGCHPPLGDLSRAGIQHAGLALQISLIPAG